VDKRAGIISTVAGTGVAGFGGDGGPAGKAQLRQPHSIVFDPQGRLLICDIGNHRVRRVDLKTGKIETWLGTGERKPTPDGAPLAGTALNGPRAMDVDPQGNIYLVLREGNAVYRVDTKTGKYVHLAGTGEKGHDGDNGPAKKARLNGPKGIAWSPDGGIYIADTESHTVRRIDLRSGIITTVAGSGATGRMAIRQCARWRGRTECSWTGGGRCTSETAKRTAYACSSGADRNDNFQEGAGGVAEGAAGGISEADLTFDMKFLDADLS